MHFEHLRRDAGGKHRQMPAVEIRKSGVRALIWHMHDVGQARELLEQLGAQMRRRARARRAVGELAGIDLGVGDQLLQRVDGQACVHHERRDRHRGDGDWREILDRIVGLRAHDHGTDDKLAGGAGEQRVAVRLGARDRGGRDDPATAALVLDDTVAELRLDLLGPQARDHVHHAAGRARHDQPDRLFRVSALRACGERSEHG